MYKILFFLLALALGHKALAQQPPWVTTYSALGNVMFNTPTVPDLYTQDSIEADDTIQKPQFAFYKSAIDDYVSVQVHIVDEADIDPEDEMIQQMLAEQGGDKLRTIAACMLLTTDNSQLVELMDVAFPHAGLQVGLKVTKDQDDPNLPPLEEYIFSRYTLANNKLYVFTVTGRGEDLDRMEDIRNELYNSIIFE